MYSCLWHDTYSQKGPSKDICTAKFKKRGEHCIMTYSDELVAIKLPYRKHVTLLSTAFNCTLIDTGKKRWKNNEPVKKHDLVYQYNRYMGGVWIVKISFSSIQRSIAEH